MPSKRESIYRCVLSASGVQHVAHVRAWDAEEAAQLFRTELRADGLETRGAIEISEFSKATRTSCASR